MKRENEMLTVSGNEETSKNINIQSAKLPKLIKKLGSPIDSFLKMPKNTFS